MRTRTAEGAPEPRGAEARARHPERAPRAEVGLHRPPGGRRPGGRLPEPLGRAGAGGVRLRRDRADARGRRAPGHRAWRTASSTSGCASATGSPRSVRWRPASRTRSATRWGRSRARRSASTRSRCAGEDGEFLGRHRGGGQPPQRGGDAVPRLRPAAEAELRHRWTSTRWWRRTIRLIQNEIPSRLALVVELGENLPAVDGRRRAAQAGADQPGAERDRRPWATAPGSIRVRTGGPERFGEFRAPRASSWRSHVVRQRPGHPAGAAAATSSCPSSPPSRRAPAWGSPSASAS